MKHKHISMTALLAVLVIMSITTTVFASAAPEDKQNPQTTWVYDQAVEDSGVTILSKGGEDGQALYSVDEGRTWMNQEQYHAKYDSWSDGWHVEWWTYEEYAAWLEEEKAVLQSIIGERGYTGSKGWFTWDQKMVDEAVAMYEEILENIKNGALYSKTIVDKNGNEIEDVALGSNSPIVSTRFENSVVSTNEGDAGYAAWLEELKALGVTGTADALYYNGQLVHTIVDASNVDHYCDYKNDSGTIDLQIQRAMPAGRWDTSGRMSGILSERDAGFDKALTEILGVDDSVWRSYGSGAPENANAIEVVFARYEKYGLVYLPRECGIGSVTYGGQPVRSFSDQRPDGGVFSFEDPYIQEGLKVCTEYDRNGSLIGLTAEPAPMI